ncbi:MAG: insulinase family protein [Akkermansia sp.]|nr:insulinase family protein [Akkermansia sp.]
MNPYFLISLALGALIPLPLMGQESAPAAEQSAAPLAQDPELLSGQLENGLHYLIRHTSEPAGRGSLRLFVNTGSLNEDETNSGISHFLEHMVFNGSRHFKRGELIPTMQKLGLGFGGDANAYTSFLQTVYMLDLPSLDEHTVDFALTIMRDFADGALLEDDAIDHERGIVVSELKARDSAAYRAGMQMIAQMVPGTRLPVYTPIGKEEVIRHAPYSVVRDYYRDNYVPQRMTVIATGDFNPADMEQLIRQHFASITDSGNPPRPAIGTPDNFGADERIIPNPEQANTQLSVTVVSPYREKPDTTEQRLADMPLQLARTMLNRRSTRMAREAHSPFIPAAAGSGDLFETAELFTLSAVAEPAKWQAALTAAEQELRRAAQYGFSAQEMEEAAAMLMSGCRQAEATWSTTDAKSMADALVNSLAEKTVPTAPAEDTRVAKIGLAQVMADPDLCRQALAKAYEADRAKLSLAGAVPEGATPAALREAFSAAHAAEVSAAEEAELKPYAYPTIGEAGHITAQTTLEDIGVTMLTLSNGVKVNLKPVDFAEGEIAVSASVDGGTLRLNHTPGLATMCSAVIGNGGLEAHSRTELQRLMAGHHVGMNFEPDSTRFNFNGVCSPEDLELQCNLLAAAILHPGYRNEGEVLLRRSLPASYNKMRTTPQGAQSYQGNRVIFGNDARFVIPTQEQAEAVTTEQVKEAMTPWLREGAMEVTLVGEFKPEEVLPILEKTFGALPARSAEFTPLSDAEKSVRFAPWGQRAFLRYDTTLDKTLVTQVRFAGDGSDKHRNRRLQVLASIAREKLFDGLRAELGESYSPTCSLGLHSDFPNAAILTTTSAGVKGNRVKVNSAMDAILTDIGRGRLTQDDADCALRPIITGAEKARRTIAWWMGNLSELQSNPERLGLIRDQFDDLRSITLDELNNLAREVFGSEKVDYLFTVPADYQEEGAEAPAEEPSTAAADDRSYTILLSPAAAQDAAWAEVAETLKKKHPQASLRQLPELNEETLAAALRETGARYAALIATPAEIGRETVTILNRAARRVDDDPWGDCICGIITGASAEEAQQLAADDEALIIKRLLATTNVGWGRFEHSCCITDWTDVPVLEQSGYTEPQPRPCKEQALAEFRKQLETERPQMLVTSSHATPFNLEMPFGYGLIFPSGNRFHLLPEAELHEFAGKVLDAAMGKGDLAPLHQIAETHESIAADGERRVWLAAGNCLFGNAAHTADSMAVTALSGYGCRQVAGYTVPSWFGAAGWGTLGLFCGNTNGTTLAEAAFLNNQFILLDSLKLDPKLLHIRFDGDSFAPGPMIQAFMKMRIALPHEKVQEAMGLIHDRDVFALYGDPAFRAAVDVSHAPAPYSVTWDKEARTCTLTANADTKERAALWFPDWLQRETVTPSVNADSVITNDFILFPALDMKKGESKTVRF